MSTTKKLQDTPLSATVEDGQLVIRIGVNTLEFCTQPKNGGHLEDCKVDARKRFQFAKDVVLAMCKEEDNGDTPLTLFLDEMIQDAADSGRVALIYQENSTK